MDLTFLKDSFIKNEVDQFVAINLGNCYVKGLVVDGDKVVDYFIEKKEDLSITLKKLLAEKKIPFKNIRISVKNPACLVRYFSFPKMDKKRLVQALFYEMNKLIPFTPEDVYFDYAILEDISLAEVAILLAVAKKEFIDNILESFDGVGLRVGEVNLDSVCLSNLFLNNYQDAKDKNSCILDIGYNFSTMTIINKGIPFLTRDVKFSVKDVFQVIARIKGKPFADIENKIFKLENNGELLKLNQDSISIFCKELKSSFDYFEVNKSEPINKVYLSGGLASAKGIENIFVEALDTEVEILQPFLENNNKINQVFFSKEFDLLRNNFSVLFGLIL